MFRTDSSPTYLISTECGIVPSGDKRTFSTGVILSMSTYHYADIRSLNELTIKHGVGVIAMVLTSDYREEVKVTLCNFSDNDFTINIGDRIAQLIFTRYTNDGCNVLPYAPVVASSGNCHDDHDSNSDSESSSCECHHYGVFS